MLAQQTPTDAAPNGTLVLPLLLVAALVVIVLFAVWLIRAHLHEAHERELFLELQGTMGFEPVSGEDELRIIAERIGELFGEHAIYARHLRVAGALRRIEDDGLTLDAAQVRLGMDTTSNANIYTLAKLVIMIHRDDLVLPEFSLVPNHFLFASVQRNPVFHHSGEFGRHNLVLGDDKWFIAHTLSGDARDALADNRDLVIESRGNLLAFYLHDERVQSAELEAFIDRCLTLSHHMILNAHAYTPAREPRRVTRHPLLQM